jgi:hypothetical protein
MPCCSQVRSWQILLQKSVIRKREITPSPAVVEHLRRIGLGYDDPGCWRAWRHAAGRRRVGTIDSIFSHPEQPAMVDARERAAAGADFDDIDGWNIEHVA